MKKNIKTIIVFFSFAVGIGSYLALFLIITNHPKTLYAVVPYWELILTRMSIITPDFYNEGSFLFLGGIYFALILLIGFIIIKTVYNKNEKI